MCEYKEAFHANETKVVALLSSNLGFFLEGLHVDTERSLDEQSLLNSPHLTCAHRTHALLCCLDEDASGQGYERLLRLIEERSKDDSTFRTVATDVRASVVNPVCTVKGPPGDAPGSKLPPHLLGFVLCWEQPRIRTLLGVSWLQAMPALSELGLMAPALRRRLVKRNCTSDEKAAMILDQLASSPDSAAAVLTLLRRLSLNDSAAGVLLQSIDVKLRSLLEEKVAGVLNHRIRRVLFPTATCWPKRIELCEPLDETVYQQLYCRVWQLSRSGQVTQAFSVAASGSRLHCDVQAALAEVALTGVTHDLHLYQGLESLLLQCRRDACCWNSDLLCARIHKRLVVYYFYAAQDMSMAYHHLYKGYELSSRLQPDEGTARIIAAWAEYMHIVGDYEESRRCFALAVEHAERVPGWMKPMVEAVKIDKAHFHVHRGNLLKNEHSDCNSVSEKEIQDAQDTLESLDLTILPPSHLSFAHYVLARIALYRQNLSAAKNYTRRAIKLEPTVNSPNYRRVSSLQSILSMM